MGTVSLDKAPTLGVSLDPGLLRLLPLYPHVPQHPFRLTINPTNEWAVDFRLSLSVGLIPGS